MNEYKDKKEEVLTVKSSEYIDSRPQSFETTNNSKILQKRGANHLD